MCLWSETERRYPILLMLSTTSYTVDIIIIYLIHLFMSSFLYFNVAAMFSKPFLSTLGYFYILGMTALQEGNDLHPRFSSYHADCVTCIHDWMIAQHRCNNVAHAQMTEVVACAKIVNFSGGFCTIQFFPHDSSSLWALMSTHQANSMIRVGYLCNFDSSTFREQQNTEKVIQKSMQRSETVCMVNSMRPHGTEAISMRSETWSMSNKAVRNTSSGS